MIRAVLNPWLISAFLVFAGASYMLGRSQGYTLGQAVAEAKTEAARVALQKGLFAAGEELSRQSFELEQLRADQQTRQREFEDAARGDPANARPGIGLVGLQDLDRLWSAP